MGAWKIELASAGAQVRNWSYMLPALEATVKCTIILDYSIEPTRSSLTNIRTPVLGKGRNANPPAPAP
jgi:hypothetical protein